MYFLETQINGKNSYFFSNLLSMFLQIKNPFNNKKWNAFGTVVESESSKLLKRHIDFLCKFLCFDRLSWTLETILNLFAYADIKESSLPMKQLSYQVTYHSHLKGFLKYCLKNRLFNNTLTCEIVTGKFQNCYWHNSMFTKWPRFPIF